MEATVHHSFFQGLLLLQDPAVGPSRHCSVPVPIPTPACSSELSLCCPGYCYQAHMPLLLDNIPIWI